MENNSLENEVLNSEKVQNQSDNSEKFRVTLVGDAAKKLNALSEELKKRGAPQKSLVELISKEILEKTDTFFEKWLDEVTPGNFYLAAIQSDPDLQSKLEKVLKQMYFSKSKTPQSRGLSKRLSTIDDIQPEDDESEIENSA